MECLAHRGFGGVNPENTLAAGADGIKLDVRRCGSGEPPDRPSRPTSSAPVSTGSSATNRAMQVRMTPSAASFQRHFAVVFQCVCDG